MELDYCNYFKTKESCFNDNNCAWCLNEIDNSTMCIGDYKCYKNLNCYSQKQDVCTIVYLFFNLTIILGYGLSIILISTSVNYFFNLFNINGNNLSSVGVVCRLLLILPSLFMYFLEGDLFINIYWGVLGVSLFVNLFFYKT